MLVCILYIFCAPFVFPPQVFVPIIQTNRRHAIKSKNHRANICRSNNNVNTERPKIKLWNNHRAIRGQHQRCRHRNEAKEALGRGGRRGGETSKPQGEEKKKKKIENHIINVQFYAASPTDEKEKIKEERNNKGGAEEARTQIQYGTRTKRSVGMTTQKSNDERADYPFLYRQNKLVVTWEDHVQNISGSVSRWCFETRMDPSLSILYLGYGLISVT